MNSDKMKPCIRDVNMPAGKLVEIHHLFFPIRHMPEWSNCNGTILVFRSKPDNHYINQGAKILGLQEVVEMTNTWV